MGAGRKEGSLNKSKPRLVRALKAEYGESFDAILKIAYRADIIDKLVDDPEPDCKLSAIERNQAAINAWKEIAPYTHAKLRAIEINSDELANAVARIIVSPKSPDTPPDE